jgi:hypothetical protein
VLGQARARERVPGLELEPVLALASVRSPAPRC